MVHSMLFTNCVKEQCYQEKEEEEEEEEESASKQTHTHICWQERVHTHKRTRSRIRYKRSMVSGGSLFYLLGLATGS